MELPKQSHDDIYSILADVGRRTRLIRLADGEAAALQCRSIKGRDGWELKGSTQLQLALIKSLTSAYLSENSRWWMGFSCPCCDARSYEYYRGLRGALRLYLEPTISNIFVNRNWPIFLEWFKRNREDILLVGSKDECDYKISPTLVECEDPWQRCQEMAYDIIRSRPSLSCIALSVGPLSPILAYHLSQWENEGTGHGYSILDVGSAPYRSGPEGYKQKGHPNATKFCSLIRNPLAC